MKFMPAIGALAVVALAFVPGKAVADQYQIERVVDGTLISCVVNTTNSPDSITKRIFYYSDFHCGGAVPLGYAFIKSSLLNSEDSFVDVAASEECYFGATSPDCGLKLLASGEQSQPLLSPRAYIHRTHIILQTLKGFPTDAWGEFDPRLACTETDNTDLDVLDCELNEAVALT
jgi:hypothetical protein